MKFFKSMAVVILVASLGCGVLLADELDESVTLEESLKALQVTARVIRKAAMEEGYSWEESRMVAIAAMEEVKAGTSENKLMKAVRERSRKQIKADQAEMLKTQSRIQTRTRLEDGNMSDDAKRYLNRKEEAARDTGKGAK